MVQIELMKFIEDISENIKELRLMDSGDQNNGSTVRTVLKTIYEILRMICKHNRINQQKAWRYLHFYIEDFFYTVGSEELVITIFENNYSLLCKVPEPLK